jgi:hypothetical protein
MDERVITCWYRLTGEEAGFNHISDGYNEERPRPRPINDFQKQAWRHQQWEGRKAKLVDGVVVEDGPTRVVRTRGRRELDRI